MRTNAGRPRRGGRKTRRLVTLTKLILILAVVGMAAAAPLAAGAAYRYVARLPLFSVSYVRVTGLKYVRRDDFIRYIRDPRGGSILKFGMDAALRRALEHPWIKDAVIRREFPDTVRFDVVERVPAAVADTGSGRFLVDNDGYAVSSVDGPGWEFLPVIEYRPHSGLKLLDEKAAEGLRNALELLRVMRGESAERLPGARPVIASDGMPCLIYDGALVKVGEGGYEEKVKRLSEVARDLDRRGATPALIDLRFPGKVVVKEARADKPGQSPQAKGGE